MGVCDNFVQEFMAKLAGRTGHYSFSYCLVVLFLGVFAAGGGHVKFMCSGLELSSMSVL